MATFKADAQIKKDSIKPEGEKYCAKRGEGRIKVLAGEKEIVSDIKLENGVKITPNGTVVKRNGTKVTLKDGECVDESGAIIKALVR